jgi:lipopolysaccharide heptosyltransferase III
MTARAAPSPILAIHPGALGDVLQAVPALRALRGLGDGGRVTFAGQPRLAHLLVGAGAVDEALSIDALGLTALFAAEPPTQEVRDRLGRFERAVSWFASGAEPYPAQLRAAVRHVLLARPVPGPDGPPVWRHLLETLAPWGIARESLVPLHVPPAWRERGRSAVAQALPHPNRPPLLVHPGAGGSGKRWAAARFAVVLDDVRRRTGCPLLVHEGPADAAAVAALEEALGAALPRLREPDLPVLAGVLADAGAYVGSDSGVSHLAASLGASAVILFPARTCNLWAPWSPTAVAVEAGSERDDPGAVADLLAASLTNAREGR